jgi:polyhydroxyalkanoate synthesis regulator phasin
MAESRSSRGGSKRTSGSRGGSGSRSGSGRSGGGRSSSARSSSKSSSRSGGSTRAKSSSTRAKSSSSRSSAQTKRRAAAKKGGQARGRQQKAQKTSRRATGGAEFSGKSVAELRDALAKGVVAPLNIVMISRERIEEVVDDAVKRGRMTADDAQDLVQGLVQRGRKQTNDVLRDLEQLLGRGGEAIEGARKRGATAAKRSRSRVRDVVDPALATADRARRVARVGPNFPVLGYDDLTAAQVQGRLDGLTAAELRKVRDYERRNANRKSVLDAVESKLS